MSRAGPPMSLGPPRRHDPGPSRDGATMKTTTLTWVSALAMSLTATSVYALTPSGGFSAVRAKPEQLENVRFDVGGSGDRLAASPNSTSAPTAEPVAFAPVEPARADFTPGIATALPVAGGFDELEKKSAPPVALAKAPRSSGARTSHHRSGAAPPARQSKPRSLPNEAVAQAPPRSEPRVFATSPPQAFSAPLPTSFQSSAPPPQAAFPTPSSTSFGGKGKR